MGDEKPYSDLIKQLKIIIKRVVLGKINYEYGKEMDEIFGKDPAVTPLVTASGTSAGNKRKIENDSDDSHESLENETV